MAILTGLTFGVKSGHPNSYKKLTKINVLVVVDVLKPAVETCYYCKH
ncbi:MAG: hypothetical protein CLLPBCKN_005505 [Chroococcidiopsis cubana SAG 39.79]|nr:hypothetical protein [Chroococcidiopsis cubana SAG 39.79]